MTRRTVSKPGAANIPKPVQVQAKEGVPVAIARERIESVQESWLVEDRWWTEEPIRRRYWELIATTGRRLVVFHDLQTGGWFKQAV